MVLRKYFEFISLLFLMVAVLSCGDDFVPEVDERMKPYFERFTEEAAKRGVEFDYVQEGYQGKIQNIDIFVGSGVLGWCQRPSNRLTVTTIYIDDVFWANATDLEKEYVVFHELGHCFLNRAHPMPAPTDSNGNCTSMMAAGNASCNGIQVYDLDRREELIDELFAN